MSKLSNCFRKYLCCGKNIICKKLLLKKLKINPILYSRIGYIVLFLLAIGYSELLYLCEDSILTGFQNNLECHERSKDSIYSCLEISSVYRLSFAFVLLHFGCFCISLSNNKRIKIIAQNELWPLKLFFIIAIYYFSLYVSNAIFNKFAMVAKYISVIYLLYQLILNVYFAHLVNLRLIYGFDNYNSKNRYKNAIIVFTLIFFLIAIYFLVLSLFNFESNWYNIAAAAFNIAFGLLNIYISISHFVKEKRLLTSLCIFSYSCYITWAAMNSEPSQINQNYSNQRYANNTNTNISNLLNNLVFSVLNNNNKFDSAAAAANKTTKQFDFYNINNNDNETNFLSFFGNFTWNADNKILRNTEHSFDDNLILDLSESIFGLIYVLLALVFIGFFTKTSSDGYKGYDPFGSQSEIDSELDISSMSNQESYKKEREILETCNTLAISLQFRYSEGKR